MFLNFVVASTYPGLQSPDQWPAMRVAIFAAVWVFVCASFFLKQNTCIFQTTKPFWLITVATCISVGHLQFDNSVDNFGSSPGHFSTKVLA